MLAARGNVDAGHADSEIIFDPLGAAIVGWLIPVYMLRCIDGTFYVEARSVFVSA